MKNKTSWFSSETAWVVCVLHLWDALIIRIYILIKETMECDVIECSCWWVPRLMCKTQKYMISLIRYPWLVSFVMTWWHAYIINTNLTLFVLFGDWLVLLEAIVLRGLKFPSPVRPSPTSPSFANHVTISKRCSGFPKKVMGIMLRHYGFNNINIIYPPYPTLPLYSFPYLLTS